MLRYVVVLLLVVVAMLALRRLLRAREGGVDARAAPSWPWLLVPVVVAVLLLIGFAYRDWALAP